MKQLGVHNKFQFSKSDLLHLSNSQETKIQLQSTQKLAFITVDSVQKKQKQIKTLKNNKRIILPASKINLTLTQQQIISPQIQYGKKNLVIPHKTLNELLFTNQQSVQKINTVEKIITNDFENRIHINTIDNNLHKQNSGQNFSSLESKDSLEQNKDKLPFSNLNMKSNIENTDKKLIQSNQFSLIDNNNDTSQQPLKIAAQFIDQHIPTNYQNAHSNLTIRNVKYKKNSFQIQKDQNGRQDSKSAQSNIQGQQSANTNIRDISNLKELPSQIMHSLPRSSFLMSEQLNQQQQIQSQINNQTFFVDKELQNISSLQQNDKQQDVSDSLIDNLRDSKLKIQRLQEKQKNINQKYNSQQSGEQSQLDNHRIMLGNFKKQQMLKMGKIQDQNKMQSITLQEFNQNFVINNNDLNQDFNLNQDIQFNKTGKIDLSNDQNKKNQFLNLNQQMNITNALKLENFDQTLNEKLKLKKKSYIPAISIESDLENVLVNQKKYQQQLSTFQSRRRTMNDSKTIYNTSKNQNEQQKFIFPSLTGKKINQETMNFSSPQQSSFNQHNQSIFMKSTLNNSVLNDRKMFKNTKTKIEIDNHNERMQFIRQKNSLNFLVKEKEQIYDYKNILNQTIQDRISIIDQIKQQEKLIDIISKYFK